MVVEKLSLDYASVMNVQHELPKVLERTDYLHMAIHPSK